MKIKERVFVLLSICLLTFNLVLAADQGTLQVTSITPTQTLATPNGNFDDGWEWIFNVTVPNNETVLKMKFADWTSGTSTIPTGSNVRFFSPQSINAYSTSTAKVLTSNSYGDTIILNPNLDLSSQTVGRQIQIVVQVRVPGGTGGGNYSSSYGISSDLDPTVQVGTVGVTVDPGFQNIRINGNQTQMIVGQVSLQAHNEDVRLNSIRFDSNILEDGSGYSGFTNMKLFFNGSQIGQPQDEDYRGGPNPISFNFGTDVVLRANQSNTLILKSDVLFYQPSSATTTLSLFIDGQPNNGQGLTTNRIISVFPNKVFLSTSTMTNVVPTDTLGLANFVGQIQPGTSQSVNVGTTDQVLWSKSLNVSRNSLNLTSIKFKMIGSAPTNAISNAKIYVDGTAKGTATINSSSEFIFNLSNVNLQTGAHLIEMKGDLVAGANRSFYINLESGTDVVFQDPVYGVVIAPTFNTTELINISGPVVTMNSGTLTITQDPLFSNTTLVVGGATQVTVAKFKYTAYSEDMKMLTFAVQPQFNGFSNLKNLALYVDGAQVGSSIFSVSPGTTLVFTGLGNNFYIPAGQTVTVELKADIMDSNSVALTTGSMSFNLIPSNAIGVSSSNVIFTPAASGQTLSIGQNISSFGVTAGFNSSTKSPNSSGVKIGSFTLQDGQAEAISVNQIVVNLAGTMVSSNQLTNLTLKDSSTGNIVGTPIGNPTATNNFNANVSVPVNSTKTFDIYADFGSSSTGLTIIPSMTLTYRGATTNLTSTTGTVAGVTITSNSPTITANDVSFNAGVSPTSQFVIGGQNNFNIGTFNFKVSNNISGATIQDITFTVPANTITSITVNGKSSTLVGNTATIFGVNISVPNDNSGINVPVSVSLTCVGTNNGCAQNSPASTSVALNSFTYNNGSAVVSVTGVNAITNSFSVVGSKPTLTVNSTQATGFVLGAENKIGEVTIAADAAGNIKLNQIAFIVNIVGGSNPSVTGMRLASGGTTVQGTSCTSSFICSFPDNYVLQAGTSQTFSLFATVNGNSISASGSSLVPQNFRWSDLVGGGTNLDGTQIYNFPTNSYSIRQ